MHVIHASCTWVHYRKQLSTGTCRGGLWAAAPARQSRPRRAQCRPRRATCRARPPRAPRPHPSTARRAAARSGSSACGPCAARRRARSPTGKFFALKPAQPPCWAVRPAHVWSARRRRSGRRGNVHRLLAHLLYGSAACKGAALGPILYPNLTLHPTLYQDRGGRAPQRVRQRPEDGADALAGHEGGHALGRRGRADGHGAAGRGGQARRGQLGGHAAGAPIAPASCPLPSAWGLLSRGAHPSQHPCNCSGPAVSVQHAPACWRRPRTTAAAGHARSVESCTGSRAAACPCRSHAPRALCEHASAVHPPCCDLGTGNPVPGGYPITGSGRARTWSAARSATSWIGCAAGSVAGLAVNRPSTSVSRTSQSARTSVATCRPPQQTLCRPSTPTLHVREQDQPVRAHQRRHLAPPPHQPLCRPFTQALTAERWPLLARLRWHELTGHVRSTLLNGF